MNQDKNVNKIQYTLLKDLKDKSELNCYGIIYDASFPQYSEKSQKDNSSMFECTIKLIDQYINPIEFPDETSFNNNIKTLIIKSNFKEQIPFIHTIGDIIRVQNCYVNSNSNKNIYIIINIISKIQYLVLYYHQKNIIHLLRKMKELLKN